MELITTLKCFAKIYWKSLCKLNGLIVVIYPASLACQCIGSWLGKHKWAARASRFISCIILIHFKMEKTDQHLNIVHHNLTLNLLNFVSCFAVWHSLFAIPFSFCPNIHHQCLVYVFSEADQGPPKNVLCGLRITGHWVLACAEQLPPSPALCGLKILTGKSPAVCVCAHT